MNSLSNIFFNPNSQQNTTRLKRRRKNTRTQGKLWIPKMLEFLETLINSKPTKELFDSGELVIEKPKPKTSNKKEEQKEEEEKPETRNPGADLRNAFGKIQLKLQNKSYARYEEVHSELSNILLQCLRNTASTSYYSHATQLQELFDNEWPSVANTLRSLGRRSLTNRNNRKPTNNTSHSSMARKSNQQALKDPNSIATQNFIDSIFNGTAKIIPSNKNNKNDQNHKQEVSVLSKQKTKNNNKEKKRKGSNHKTEVKNSQKYQNFQVIGNKKEIEKQKEKGTETEMEMEMEIELKKKGKGKEKKKEKHKHKEKEEKGKGIKTKKPLNKDQSYHENNFSHQNTDIWKEIQKVGRSEGEAIIPPEVIQHTIRRYLAKNRGSKHYVKSLKHAYTLTQKISLGLLFLIYESTPPDRRFDNWQLIQKINQREKELVEINEEENSFSDDEEEDDDNNGGEDEENQDLNNTYSQNQKKKQNELSKSNDNVSLEQKHFSGIRKKLLDDLTTLDEETLENLVGPYLEKIKEEKIKNGSFDNENDNSEQEIDLEEFPNEYILTLQKQVQELFTKRENSQNSELTNRNDLNSKNIDLTERKRTLDQSEQSDTKNENNLQNFDNNNNIQFENQSDLENTNKEENEDENENNDEDFSGFF
ncbi:hypothetical protein M0812_29115 [Anaeramoeba flamelloides]|uniref:Uncharacterized protein n=1 Tax=Anaeramoeba flamelloides TaxID=1746091 RepID=A0AAV7Y6Z6_9EUKA|nr:hypothetical protein M0812_29115 [Anaeramoeba flamelloides]